MTLGVYPERFSRPNPDPDRTILKIATLFLILALIVDTVPALRASGRNMIEVIREGGRLSAPVEAGCARLSWLFKLAALACFLSLPA